MEAREIAKLIALFAMMGGFFYASIKLAEMFKEEVERIIGR